MRKCSQGKQKGNLGVKAELLFYVSVMGTKALLRDKIKHISLYSGCLYTSFRVMGETPKISSRNI